MIAARQIAFGGSKRKPYDAEIEYLESTGTQYIDTGIYADNEYDIEFKINLHKPPEQTWYGIFGTFAGTGGKTCSVSLINYTNKRFSGGWDGVAYREWTLGDSDFGQDFKFSLNKEKALVNGLQWGSYNASVINPTGFTMLLFADSGRNIKKFVGKVYNLTIKHGDEIILDFIPVRKRGIGYMYDKVSGRLFGNAGTGAFVLGSDI